MHYAPTSFEYLFVCVIFCVGYVVLHGQTYFAHKSYKHKIDNFNLKLLQSIVTNKLTILVHLLDKFQEIGNVQDQLLNTKAFNDVSKCLAHSFRKSLRK